MDGPLSKYPKLSNSELYKPPTNEEINKLQETQNLFHSNLIKLQISEVLNEVTISKGRRTKIDNFLHNLHKIINEFPITEKFKLHQYTKVLGKGVKVPFTFKPKEGKGMMKCGPPSDIKLIGSYMLQTEIKNNLIVDLMLVLPIDSMQEKDFLNQRYMRKRAIYLAFVAKNLKNNDLIEEISFKYKDDDPQRPILVLKPSGKLNKAFKIHVFVSLPPMYFKENRFLPNSSNIRKTWYLKEESSDDNNLPSPHYNGVVSRDLLMDEHLRYLHGVMNNFTSMKDAIKLLKIWLKQRELDEGYGSFSGFIMSMLLAYLLQIHKINKLMSSYQITRITFNYLANTNWMESGICLHAGGDISMFTKHDNVVFLDNTGKINLCAGMTSAQYSHVKHEAALSLATLDNKLLSNSFDLIFMEKIPHVQKFDQFLHISNMDVLRKICDKEALIDHGENAIIASIPRIVMILERSLKERIHVLGVKPPNYNEWRITSKPPSWNDTNSPLTIGLLLNEECYSVPLEKGPLADSAEALDFRNFWGERSDLRRFQDSTIREAVVWSHETQMVQRTIPLQICKHVLKQHCNIDENELACIADQLELQLTDDLNGNRNILTAGDENYAKLMTIYNKFCTMLRNIKNITLSINSLQGISSELHFSAVKPPKQTYIERHNHKIDRIQHNIAVPTVECCPPFVPALEVVCHMEGSGKWPQDAAALQRVKAAFHVSLAQELRAQCASVACAAKQDNIDVWFEGYVFRVIMAYHREVNVLKTIKTPDGMIKIRDTPQSQQLEMKTVFLPWLNSALHGLHQTHKTYGLTCRLAKKWIGAKMLTRHIPYTAIELLCAHVYTNPRPFSVPASAHCGFVRFLWFLSSFDFQANPIILNISSEMNEGEVRKIEDHFHKNRESLPTIFIATPIDQNRSVWTSMLPIPTMLHRLKALASIAYKDVINECLKGDDKLLFKNVFTSSLAPYDIVIHLRNEWIAKRIKHEENNETALKPLLPVVDFDPVELYLKELEASYGGVALFFNDDNSGSSIGVLWKPNAFATKPFKIVNLPRMATEDGKTLSLNVNAIVEDFKIIGQGLVDTIELRTEKWRM